VKVVHFVYISLNLNIFCIYVQLIKREVSSLSSSQNLLSVSQLQNVYLYYQNLTLLIIFEGTMLKDRIPVSHWLESS
jgi:hypothetical protein